MHVDYYSTAAQIIPLAFIVVVFQLATAFRYTRDPGIVPMSAEAEQRAQTHYVLLFMGLAVTAIIGETAALATLHAGHSDGRRDTLIVLALAIPAVHLVLSPLAFWNLDRIGPKLELLLSPDAAAPIDRVEEMLESLGQRFDPELLEESLAQMAEAKSNLERLKMVHRSARVQNRIGGRLIDGLLVVSLVTPAYWVASLIFGVH